MARNGTDNADKPAHGRKGLVFVHATGAEAVQSAWLDGILELGLPVFSHRPLEGCATTRHDYGELGELLAELAGAARGQPVIVIRHGLAPAPWQVEAIASALAATDRPLARTVLSNAWPGLNPFAGLSGGGELDLDDCAAAVRLLGNGLLLRHHEWPGHLAALSPAAVTALANPSVTPGNALLHLEQAGGRVEVPDVAFAGDPCRGLFSAPRLDAHETLRPPSWGELAARLQTWLDAGSPKLPAVGSDGRPVTLHVSHSWGGGVTQWVRTFIEHDGDSAHLQLISEGAQSGQGHGQRIVLYAGNRLDCPLDSWWIQPPLQSVEDRNDRYRQVLDSVTARYGVGRVIVSSLVGHSLDALRTGLPTVQVLHDYFPVWPLLGVHPEPYIGEKGDLDLERALAETTRDREFTDMGAGAWTGIRDGYFEALEEFDVRVAAPGQSVVELQKRLDKRWMDIGIRVIPHAFPPLENAGPVKPKSRQDERLRLVIIGRILPGKGQALLQKALPRLTACAHVYLVGAGKNGEAFFGIPGVSVLVEYHRDELPGVLQEIGPHVAALLSVVPETFSYTLSELQFLGIPAIATRVGSFAERIDDGVNGWLIDPSPWALADRVEELHADPALIEPVRQSLDAVHHGAPEAMVAAYNDLCPAGIAEASVAPGRPDLWSDQAGAAAFDAALGRTAVAGLEKEKASLAREVKKRTEWALERERELAAEQAGREKVQRYLEQSDAHLVKARKDFDQALEEKKRATAETERVSAKLADTRSVLAETRDSLECTADELKETGQRLQAALDLQARIVSSTSWRMTRPFRVLRRIVAVAIRSRAWNPLRWPLLLARFSHNLATAGLRGTLMRMQLSGQTVPPEAPREERPMPVEKVLVPTALPRSDQPEVSIVIPAYNNWKYTAACLQSIAGTAGTRRMEVILVDDSSTDATPDTAPAIGGLRYLRNEENLGFIGSCNRGVEAARGEFTVLLNNDTQALEGWLDALLDTFASRPDAGLVGARLVYPDGRLQECGGLIFSNGSGWNYGRGDDPGRPEYQYLRESDYCSGACLMIRTEFFRELGGFDTRYAPAYYEDTDLAFRVREAGAKVYVQPRATVVHHEGITSGTDINSGTKQYQVTNQQTFLDRWRGVLEEFPAGIEDPDDLAQVRRARDHRQRGRVLIIDATTPEPDQDSGSVRLTNMMHCFMELGFGVTFFADNRCHAGRYTRELQEAGVEVWHQPWLDSLSGFFEEHGGDFDYVLVSRHYVAVNYLSLVRRHCPRARFIFDTVDLHYLREQRLADLENSLALQQAARQTKRSELSVIDSADAVLVVSPAEVEVLAEDAPDALVHVLSNIHPVHGSRRAFEQRADLFFVGGYQHPPNVDAMMWFVQDVWPLIRAELPDVSFHMIGSKAPEQIRALAGEGVVFHGFVEDLERFLDGCRVAVAPLRYGAGVKGKVNMSMSYGQPVVATPIAVEGMYAESGREVLVADSEQAFADEVVRLYRDEALWNGISAAAIENVERHFSVAAARRSIEELVGKLA